MITESARNYHRQSVQIFTWFLGEITKGYTAYEADEDAVYEAEYTIDLSTLESTVAFPHLPENTKTISEIEKPVVVDQSVIGSCTNGRIDDLRVAARILKGRKVKKGLRCIVIPATQAIYLQAMEEGLLKIFIEAGAVVLTTFKRSS